MNIISFNKIIIITSFLSFISCKNDEGFIGNEVLNNQTSANIENIDVITYNLSNNDTIQADRTTLHSAVIGAFEDKIFGKTKAEYLTQIRLTNQNPNFGINPVIDSVVLKIVPYYTAIGDDVILPPENGKPVQNSENREYITHYPLNNINGTVNSILTLSINEIDTDLGIITNKLYSNTFKNIRIKQNIGTSIIKNRVKSIIVRDGNNTVISNQEPAFNIPLNNEFFQKKILDKQGSIELNDNANFINYFKGILISLKEYTESGFLLENDISKSSIIMYYKSENPNSSTTKISSNYTFNINSGFNVSNAIYTFERSQDFLNKVNNPDRIAGDEKLYLQAMSSNGFIVKIEDKKINDLKQKVKASNLAILSAKLKFYVDSYTSDQKPRSIFAYPVDFNSNNLVNKVYILNDLIKYTNYPGWTFFNRNINSEPNYYQLDITQYISDIIYNQAENKNLKVDLGYFYNGINPNINTKAYNTDRIIFNGSKSTKNKPILEVVYANLK